MIGSDISITSLAIRKEKLSLNAFKPLVLFDLTDTSALSQDLAGFVPVTTSGQNVGLVKDKSANGNHLSAVSETSRGRFLTGYPNAISVGTSSAPSAPFDGITQSHLIQDGFEDADLRGGWHHDSDYFGLLGRQFPSATQSSGNIPASGGHGVSWQASFVVDRDFAIRIDGSDSLLGRYRVTINGVRHHPLNQSNIGPGRRWWSFKLPLKANRVVVEGYGDVRWFGFKTLPGAVVTASPARWKTIVFGDSFTTASGVAAQWDGWVNQLRPLEEFSTVASGSGGTGYVDDQSGEQAPLVGRIMDDYNRISGISGAPDEVVIALGLNDVGQSGVQAAVNATFDALRTVYTGPVWVVGPWDHYAPNPPPATWLSTRDDIRSAAQSRPGFAFVDMEGVAYTKTDSIHPDDAGHRALAEYLAPRLADTHAVPVAAPVSRTKGRVANKGNTLLQIATRFGLAENPGLTVVAAINTGVASAEVERVWHIGDGTAGTLSGTTGTGGIAWAHNDGDGRFAILGDDKNAVVAWRRPANGTYDDGEVFVNGVKQARISVDNPSITPSNTTEMFCLFGSSTGTDPFPGEISAFAVFDELSNAELKSVMSIFAAKFKSLT
ncbi:SGNH/GDSL hydrolase family protein [Ruegeria atlantica]|uniref:SGNH/GDSL hydrolase family protein n=1 Tax=Ruegeria atlantica TaxID=81569 RepID=UPI00147EE464|nr:SGNH/GDSL hydrolase family protein [Ruegeria atlantica]